MSQKCNVTVAWLHLLNFKINNRKYRNTDNHSDSLTKWSHFIDYVDFGEHINMRQLEM